ncbi:hypothetical protein CIK72_08090, partial [Brachybacterium alimentarium]
MVQCAGEEGGEQVGVLAGAGTDLRVDHPLGLQRWEHGGMVFGDQAEWRGSDLRVIAGRGAFGVDVAVGFDLVVQPAQAVEVVQRGGAAERGLSVVV